MKKRLALVFCCLSAVLLCGCSKRLERTEFLLDTVCSVTLNQGSEADLDAAFAVAERLENTFSKTRPESEIYALNQAGGGEVSPETAALLQKSAAYHTLSGGLFDVSVGALTALWKFDGSDTVPGGDAVSAALATVYDGNWQLSGNTVTLQGGARLDLGAIAKGYIAKETASELERRGAQGIVNLGGTVVTVGKHPKGAYKIGVQKPFSDALLCTVLREGGAAVTAGVYQRFFEKDGVRYHHILNPETGYPCESDLLSATVFCDDAADGDALSTICVLLGCEKAAALIESLPDTDAVFCLANGEMRVTSGIVLT